MTRSEVLQFSAGGFRDFTRIAASDPTMWRDVFLANKDAVLEMLGRFNEDISALTRAIRRGDGEALFDHFTRTRAIRKGIVAIGQDSPAPDFGRPHPDLPHEPLPRPYAAEDDVSGSVRAPIRRHAVEHCRMSVDLRPRPTESWQPRRSSWSASSVRRTIGRFGIPETGTRQATLPCAVDHQSLDGAARPSSGAPACSSSSHQLGARRRIC